MKTTMNNVKEIRAMMRNISKELGYYAQAEDFKFESRNVRDYDNAGKTMQITFDNIMRDMNEIISKLNMLGVNCDRINIHDWMRIKTERIVI